MRNKTFKTLVLGAFAVSAAILTGCFGTNDTSAQSASLTMNLGVQGVNKDGALHKGSAIKYSKLIITMVSDATVPDVIRDTITPGNFGMTDTSTVNQQVAKTYNVKPLRSWTITVVTRDTKDSVIHSATTTASHIKVGETRNITINLTAKFVMYIAKFVLPDSLRASGTSDAQVLNINRFVMTVDGKVVVDSAKLVGYYAPGAPGHSIEFDYIRADTTHKLALFVYGDVPGWPSNKPLFGDTITVTPGPDTTYTPTLPWKGPGSPEDPNYNPSNPGGASAALTINIGKVGVVNVIPVINGNQFKRK